MRATAWRHKRCTHIFWTPSSTSSSALPTRPKTARRPASDQRPGLRGTHVSRRHFCPADAFVPQTRLSRRRICPVYTFIPGHHCPAGAGARVSRRNRGVAMRAVRCGGAGRVGRGRGSGRTYPVSAHGCLQRPLSEPQHERDGLGPWALGRAQAATYCRPRGGVAAGVIAADCRPQLLLARRRPKPRRPGAPGPPRCRRSPARADGTSAAPQLPPRSCGHNPGGGFWVQSGRASSCARSTVPFSEESKPGARTA